MASHENFHRNLNKMREGEVSRHGFSANCEGSRLIDRPSAFAMPALPRPGRRAHTAAKKGVNHDVSMNIKATDDPLFSVA
jgi:hypothetical protein